MGGIPHNGFRYTIRQYNIHQHVLPCTLYFILIIMIAERSMEATISLDVEDQIQRSKKAAIDIDDPETEPKRRKLVKDVAGTYL